MHSAIEHIGYVISHNTPPQILRVESPSSLGDPQSHNQSEYGAGQDGLKRTLHTYPISERNKRYSSDNFSCGPYHLQLTSRSAQLALLKIDDAESNGVNSSV